MNVPGHTAQPHSIHLYNNGGVDQMDCLFTPITASGLPQKFALVTLCPGPQHDHSHFLVHCEIEENPPSHLIFMREVIMLSQDRSTTTNCKARARVGGGKSASMPNGVQRDCNCYQKEQKMQSVQKQCTIPKCGVRICPTRTLHVLKCLTNN